MRPHAAITVLVGLAAFARAEGIPPATSIAEIARRGPAPAADPVRVQGTVTYFDPTRRCLCLQDGGVGLFVHIPLDTRPLRPGQRVEVRGRVLAHHYVDATEARASRRWRPTGPDSGHAASNSPPVPCSTAASP